VSEQISDALKFVSFGPSWPTIMKYAVGPGLLFITGAWHQIGLGIYDCFRLD